MASSVRNDEMEVMKYLVLKQGHSTQSGKNVYLDANSLYHRLLTMTNTSEIDSINRHTRSALLIIIRENFSVEESSKYYFSILLHLVFDFNDLDIEELFLDWLGFCLQKKETHIAITFLKFVLIGLKHYLDEKQVQHSSLTNVIKSINRNIELLMNENVSRHDKEVLKELKEQFHIHVNELGIILSEPSDPDSDN